MALSSFTKIPTGQPVVDRVQDSLARIISLITTALNQGLTFGANFQAEQLSATVTTPGMGWTALKLNPTRIKSPAQVLLVAATTDKSPVYTQAMASWQVTNGQLVITNVQGLAASTKYVLTFTLLGG